MPTWPISSAIPLLASDFASDLQEFNRAQAMLKLLGNLPLDEPKRVLFGARLVNIRREAEGTCVVRFEPDSGVLLTDVASAGLGIMIPDPPLQQSLQQQRKWAVKLP